MKNIHKNKITIMSPNIHSTTFTDETQLKLEIFREYIKSWIPVFLTTSNKNTRSIINIFDFFSGPGTDSDDNEGSPLMIMNEIIAYTENNSALLAQNITINVHFNDKKKKNIKALKTLISSKYEKYLLKINVVYTDKEFSEVFPEKLEIIRNSNSANLVFLDQYGIKQVTPKILSTLTSCKYTDLLFFISSSLLKRFAEEDSMNKYISIPAEELKQIPYKQIHRRVCKAYQEALSRDDYFLAPFSIKKTHSIYGVIFGSGHLRGLEKFLEVCWKKDGITGEANYDIDSDITRYGQQALFEEDSTIKKQDEFENHLITFIKEFTLKYEKGITNAMIRRFTLTAGFLPRHSNEILKKLQTGGFIEVESAEDIRKGSFYLSQSEQKQIFIKYIK